MSAPGSGSAGSFSPYCAASSTMRGQRSGAFTTRRMEETPASRSVCAITSLAAIMKSSIRCAARLWARAVMSCTLPSVMTGCASRRSKVSAPSRWRASRSACAASSCSLSCASRSADAATLGGARGRAFEPGAHGVVSELRAVAHQGAVDAARGDGAVRGHHQFDHHAARSWFSLSEVRSVESRSGSMGKVRTPA